MTIFSNIFATTSLFITCIVLSSKCHANSNTFISSLAADRIKNEPASPWNELSKIKTALANKQLLDFGQGFADYDAAPEHLLSALRNISTVPDVNLYNQYTRSYGHPTLVKALLKYYRRRDSFGKASDEISRDLTNENEQILVTIGAYEAIFATIMAFVNAGDEVVIIEPTFDAYAPIVAMAGGKSVFVRLQRKIANTSSVDKQTLDKNLNPTTGAPLLNSSNNDDDNNLNFNSSSGEYVVDMNDFESKLSMLTKLVVLNTPNNPLGKVSLFVLVLSLVNV